MGVGRGIICSVWVHMVCTHSKKYSKNSQLNCLCSILSSNSSWQITSKCRTENKVGNIRDVLCWSWTKKITLLLFWYERLYRNGEVLLCHSLWLLWLQLDVKSMWSVLEYVEHNQKGVEQTTVAAPTLLLTQLEKWHACYCLVAWNKKIKCAC